MDTDLAALWDAWAAKDMPGHGPSSSLDRGGLVGRDGEGQEERLGGEDEDCGHTGLTGLAGRVAQLREDPALGSQAGRRQLGRVPRPRAKRTPEARRHAHAARRMHQPVLAPCTSVFSRSIWAFRGP
jgi:hypothetical protein